MRGRTVSAGAGGSTCQPGSGENSAEPVRECGSESFLCSPHPPFPHSAMPAHLRLLSPHHLLHLLHLLLLVLLNHLTSVCQAQRGAIPIGAIFDVSDLASRAAFEATVKENRNHEKRVPYYDFNVTVNSVDINDNFELASTICRQMANGVFAILGQKSMRSSDIVKAFTSTFHMPFVTPSLSRMAMREHSPYELHMKPDHTEALVDVIRHFKWEVVHFLYDSDEGMQRLQRIFRAMKNETVEWFAVKRLSDVTQVHEDLRHIDRMELGINKCFVLDLSSEEAYNFVLRQIPEVGMNKYGYNYLLGTLDFLNLNLSRFRHGGVNVTGFQLMAEDNGMEDGFLRDAMGNDRGQGQQYIPIRAALAVDGLGVIEDAVAELVRHDPDIFRYMFRRGEVYNNNRTKGIPCSTRPPEPWMHGNKLLSIMKQSRSKGFSGTLQFSEDGYRSNYSLGLYSAGMGVGVQKIGTWTTDEGFRSVFAKDSVKKKGRPRVNRHNTTRIVTTILSEPFLMLKEIDPDGTPPIGNDKYEGYCVELADKLARLIGFEYEFKLVADNAYGVKDEDGKWNGMMGELIDGIADMAIAPLTITADRERVVDFSKPFMDVGISIMIKKPEKQKPGVFSFMQPLSIEIWVCIIIAYTVISVGLFLVSRFSPVEWRKIELPSGPTFQNEFTLQNSLWFSMGALMFQGSESCPRSMPGRIIGGVWWFFVLIIISSYTANLAAFLTIERMISPIESADDLVKQTEIKYGTLKSGTTLEFFKKSDVPTYMQMWDFMSANPDVFVSTTAEGIERVRKSKGKYAFLLESSNNDYHQNRKPCDTIKVGPNLNAKSFGIATPQGSDLRDLITLGVLTLKEDGTLHQLKTKWWFEKGQCSSESDSKDSKKRPLSLSNVAGIFYILIGGLVLSIILGVFEFMCSRRKNTQGLVLRTTDTTTTLAGTPVDRELTSPLRDASHSGHFNNSNKYSSEYAHDGATPRLIGFEAFQDGHPHTDV